MKNLLRKSKIMIAIVLILQMGLGNYMTTTTFAASGPELSTDTGSASFVAGDNMVSTPVAIDSAITVTDDSSTTFASATVAITGNFHAGEDVLMFVNDGATMGNISASYDAATGVLTLTSAGTSAALAQWQSALRSITYTDTAITPDTATRTISFTATNGASAISNTATRTVTVTDTDQTPIVTTSGGSTTYIAGTAGIAIDSGVTISDLDNATLASAIVSITSGFQPGDTLSYTNTSSVLYGNIVASYNSSTGVLTLSSSGATATLAQWQSALSAVTFSSTSATPGNRIISYAVNDGTKTSAAAANTVNVMNGPPSLTTSGGSASFVAGDNTASTPVVIDSGITVTNGNSATLESAVVAITGNLHSGEDVLLFVNDGLTMGNITASYNALTGVLILTSSGAAATVAQWQSALRSIAYTDTAITPNTATRTISFTATDGASNTSNTATRTVTVTDTDQTPIVTTSGGSTDYVAGTMAITVDSGVTLSDLDNTTLASATVSITSGFHSGDALSYINTSSVLYGNIVASYNSGTGILTLTSSGATATLAQWQSALRGIAFSSTSATPVNRIISYVVNDGTKTSAAAAKAVNVIGAPSLTTSGGSASFVAGDNMASTPVIIDSGITVTDGSSTTLASATAAITGNFHAGEDVLAFTNDGATMGNVTASYDAATGVLTLTSVGAAATLAQWQSALRSIAYTDTAISPNTATRTISFTVIDGASNTSNTATRTVTVTATDQTPIVSTSGGSSAYAAGTTGIALDSGVSVSDLDNTTQASAMVSISSGFHSGDVLAFTNDGATMGNITASYDAATGVLTLISVGATATLGQWSNSLSAITFSSTSTTPGNRTISYAVSDGTKTSAAATHIVDVTVTLPPSLTASGGSASFVAGDNTASTPVVIDSGITVADDSSTTLASAAAAITSNFHAGEDVLVFTNDGATMGNIAASYDPATGVLTLTSSGATATLAQWQSALGSITYTNTAVTPNTATRTISFNVIDGAGNTSNTVTRTVTVTATNQTPVVTTSVGSIHFTSGDRTTSTPVAIDNGLTISDLDNTTLASATIAITSNFNAGEDVLAFTNVSEATYGNITASYLSASGELTLTSAGTTATLEQWQNALHAVTYNNTAVTPNTATRTISFTVNDGTNNSNSATKSITLKSLSSLSASPNTLSVLTGETASAAITAMYSDLSQTDVTTSVTWSVQNPAIASVSGGTITGLQAGSTVVTAVYGTQSTDISVTVTGTTTSGTVSPPANPANPGTPTPPAQETKAFYDLVDSNRLAAFIQDALAAGKSATFQDAASHWASKDISSAAKLGIINGYPDGSFRPDASITRAEFSTLVVKAFALRLGSGTNSFRDIQTSWARESIEILASYGVINGYSDGTFRADRKITRAEMVAMISKILILQDSKSGEAHTFVDVAPQHWANKIIEEATNAGIIQGKDQNHFAPEDNLTRAEALTVIMRMLRQDPTINNLLG
ncbi:S-layer homology domain-containing protein [Paenibacillus sp. HN-1]|uniref:S-layer homology domain-containing protein n=1 Tax=Paenibacillus TaxID=44249 RepID=UPI001CA89410|nr:MULTISPECIES: S-layer homology domain-containing protein [Paenibacillus]MBY9079200.1 S-layer homology domain-containing protein [Paenibacillus sp. CGMCC 1.18879]MBY9087363.1 S-layer homology domain-containing protein [Paenibacillus sinensis]